MMEQEQSSVHAVLQAEYAWAEALRTLDLAAIDRLMADEYQIIQPGGVVVGKTATMASLRSDQRHWEIAASDEHDVRIYGATAVVIGRWRGRGINHGQAFDYAARYLCVWVKRNGRWQIVADQSTEITEATP
jgi:ketosteroid isomerase-like protein